MSEGTETGTQSIDSSSDTMELGFRQEPEMNTQGTEISADELTLISVDDQATDSILRRV